MSGGNSLVPEMTGGNSLAPEMGGGNSLVYRAFLLPNVCETATLSKTNEKPPIIEDDVAEKNNETAIRSKTIEKPPIIRGRCGGNSLVSGAFSSPKRIQNRHSFENE